MTEVTIENYSKQFSEIEKSIHNAKLVAVDLEFSALHPIKIPSLFDNPSERYSKLRINTSQLIPIQVGITTFSFDPDNNTYNGKIYNFYVLPASFPCVQRSFCFQSDTLSFLKMYQFDFNKLIYMGIPFISRSQEIKLREKLKNSDFTEKEADCRRESEALLLKLNDSVKIWFKQARVGDYLSLPEVCVKYKYNYEMLYYIHKYFRRHFKYVWTHIENNEFVIKRVTQEEYNKLEISFNLEEELIDNLLGFTKIFRLLTSLKKPIVGHNLLQDILIMISNFETDLPQTYPGFKKLTTQLFPTIFDTKTISYNLKKLIPEEKWWKSDSSVETLFEYFKNGTGRHLVLNSPAIITEDGGNYGKYHEAGWDSFCTGYIFIRLAYLNLYKQFPKSKKFMSSELIGGLSEFKNNINVIRAAVPSIKIDGDDPMSIRPPYLVIESIKNKPVDVSQVTTMLSSFGFVEVRKFPYQSKRALIAVDNFGSARRILDNFKTHNEFQVKQYNAIKHSPIVRAFLLSGLTISGVVLLWLTNRYCKK